MSKPRNVTKEKNMSQFPTSFDKDDLLKCARGELFGEGNAQLPAPPMLMMDRIMDVSADGGAHGKGAVYREGTVIGNSTMTQVSLGLQFGGQVYKQIIFFEDARSMREFTSGEFEFNGQAAAVALNSGASAAISTGGGGRVSVTAANGESAEVDSAGFVDGMAVFTLSQGGFMVEVSIGGQKFSYDPL